MATAKNRAIVICGQGRVGCRLTERLNAESLDCLSARISPGEGLYVTEGQLPKVISTLVICIAPGGRRQVPQKWQWQDIFKGLCTQLEERKLKVENLLMVSSTRVYESIEQGLVTASTPTSADSANGQGLIIAERMLQQAVKSTLILRASGLYGAMYPVYTPIMLAAEGKPRFGIDADQLVNRLYSAVDASERGRLVPAIELLTDGKVYYQGEHWIWPSQREVIEKLAKSHRILLNSTKKNLS